MFLYLQVWCRWRENIQLGSLCDEPIIQCILSPKLLNKTQQQLFSLWIAFYKKASWLVFSCLSLDQRILNHSIKTGHMSNVQSTVRVFQNKLCKTVAHRGRSSIFLLGFQLFSPGGSNFDHKITDLQSLSTFKQMLTVCLYSTKVTGSNKYWIQKDTQ